MNQLRGMKQFRGALKRGRRKSPAGGFSMVELLVVITILAALAAGSTVYFRMAGRAKAKSVTTSRLTSLFSAIESYKLSTNSYPPTQLERLRGPDRAKVGEAMGPQNELNQGIETLRVALHLNGVNALPSDMGDETIENLDDDSAAGTEGTSLTSDQLFEYVDYWGNPFVYFHNRDYKEADKLGVYVLGDGADTEVEARPYVSEKTGAFQNAQKFQLFSMGPDGEPNTSDDIVISGMTAGDGYEDEE